MEMKVLRMKDGVLKTVCPDSKIKIPIAKVLLKNEYSMSISELLLSQSRYKNVFTRTIYAFYVIFQTWVKIGKTYNFFL